MANTLDGAEIFDNWEQLIQTPDPAASTVLDDLDISGLVGQPEKSADYWENLFQESNFGGMTLINLTYYPLTIHEEDFFKSMGAAKKVFLQDVLENYLNDLRVAGISEENIFYLKKGVLPANWTIHLKAPPLYGGRPKADNMVLMQCQPFHELIHDFINQQILTNAGIGHPKTLYVPTPIGKVYIPEGFWTGSGGKKMADRSVMAEMTESALQQATQKVGER